MHLATLVTVTVVMMELQVQIHVLSNNWDEPE